MTDVKKQQCFAVAHWLIGYAEALDPKIHPELIHKINQATNLLLEVWEEREVPNE